MSERRKACEDHAKSARALWRKLKSLGVWMDLGRDPKRVLEAIETALAKSSTDGYAEAHEHQMRMRVRDRMECEAKHGASR